MEDGLWQESRPYCSYGWFEEIEQLALQTILFQAISCQRRLITTKLPLFLMCIMQSMGKTTGS